MTPAAEELVFEAIVRSAAWLAENVPRWVAAIQSSGQLTPEKKADLKARLDAVYAKVMATRDS